MIDVPARPTGTEDFDDDDVEEPDPIMKLSRNGQVSIPAEIRRRWNVDRVLVIDMDEYVIVRPMPDNVLESLRGKYAGRGPSASEMVRINREEEIEAEDRKWGR